MYKEIKSLSLPLLLFCSTTVFSASFPAQQGSSSGITNGQGVDSVDQLSAYDDQITVVPYKISSIEGSVVSNDTNGSFVELISSPVSEYGYLVLNTDGSFIYTLYENSSSVTGLKVGDVVKDVFSYKYFADSGASATANLQVQIIGNPVDADGNTVFQAPVDVPYDNVDVEFNDRSVQATPLNSGRNIKGHLHHSDDKDWYKLASAGNEIISLEVCPQGSSCFGKKSWVLYVFDSDKLTQEMEEQQFTFSRWVDETGSTRDESGGEIISGTRGSSNHMYLAYKSGFFDGALIGVVDPCFDTSNKVDIGVGDGARNYLVAISSPLKGDTGDADSCGSGSVVLEEPGLNTIGKVAEGTDDDGKVILKDKKYETTHQFISIFPKSDDQYAIKITGTGLHPLLSEEAIAKSSTYKFDSGELMIPKVRIHDTLFQANLSLRNIAPRTAKKTNLKFSLSKLDVLGNDEATDAFQATYNPENQQVIIPRVTDLTDGKAYSVIMQYYPDSQTVDVVNYEIIH